MLLKVLETLSKVLNEPFKDLELPSLHDKVLYSIFHGYAYSKSDPIKSDTRFRINTIKQSLYFLKHRNLPDNVIYLYGKDKEEALKFIKIKKASYIEKVHKNERYYTIYLSKYLDVGYFFRSLTELNISMYYLGSDETVLIANHHSFEYAPYSLSDLYHLLNLDPTITHKEIAYIKLLKDLPNESLEEALRQIDSKLIRSTIQKMTFNRDFYDENIEIFLAFKKIILNRPHEAIWNMDYHVARLLGV